MRFIADNPGIWMLHCHIETHSDSGMMLMLKVGDENDLPKKPTNWPTCDSYEDTHVSTSHAPIQKSFHLCLIVGILIFTKY